MRKDKIAAARFLLWQWIVALCLSAIVFLLWNPVAAWSTLLGGLLAVVPNMILSFYLFLCAHHCEPKKIIKDFYVGEAVKIISTGLLLLLMLHCFNVALAPLLIGLFGTYWVYLFAPILIKR